ncbi:MAG: ammonium transporter [Actinomycetota bacterium]
MSSSDLWVLIAAAFVFLMQAGFLCFEVGLARQKHQTAVAMKNLIDWALVSTLFLTVGFGLMFGQSVFGLIGGSRFGGTVGAVAAPLEIHGVTFLLFQLAFAGTAVTIVSGALVERINFAVYMVLSAAMALLIYPVVGHWVWGGALDPASSGWLQSLGFHDFAGAGVVHLTGAMVALVGVAMVGPRIGRFRADGSVADFLPSNAPLSALGVVILWFGWWGFNGGSTLAATVEVPTVILRTNVGGAGGLLAALVVAWRLGARRNLGQSMMIGALAGLVAVTAVADHGSLVAALVVGATAGAAAPLVEQVLLELQVDDALGVFPVHGSGAIVGLVLGPPLTGAGAHGAGLQLAIQVVGVISIVTWCLAVAGVVLVVLRRTVGLRVSPAEERHGLGGVDDATASVGSSAPLTDAELADLL